MAHEQRLAGIMFVDSDEGDGSAMPIGSAGASQANDADATERPILERQFGRCVPCSVGAKRQEWRPILPLAARITNKRCRPFRTVPLCPPRYAGMIGGGGP